MDEEEVIQAIKQAITQLLNEPSLSIHAHEQLAELLDVLEEDIDAKLRADRVAETLRALNKDPRIPNQVRTQLWSVAAMSKLL